MDKHLFLVILLLSVYCVYNVENMDSKPEQPNKRIFKEKERGTCARTGGSLVSYKSVKSNPTALEYLRQLQEGQSAWIKEFAKLSPFMAWYGCFNSTYMRYLAGIHIEVIENKSLYQCSQVCLNYSSKTEYIGIKNKSCYCMNSKQSQAIHQSAVDDSMCDLPCEYNIVDYCGGPSLVSVYTIYKTRSMPWAGNEPSKRQCVYAKSNMGRFELYTASCHTLQSVSINGYICMNSLSSGSPVTSTCPENRTSVCCIVNIPSSRKEAYTSCLKRRGMLANLRSEAEVHHKMKTSFKYWISEYRTFEISDRYNEDETICLAAVRVNNKLYLEPDDCSEEKYVLCEGKTITHSSHYPDITSNTSPITFLTKSNTGPISTAINFTVPTTSAVSIATKAPTSGNVSPFAYIIPSILTFFFLVLLVVFKLYRRRKKRIGRNDCTSDDTYTAIYETDNLENGHTASAAAISAIQGQNGGSKCLIATSTSNELVRQAQQGKTEELGEYKRKKSKEMQTEDYDKIDFKKPVNVRKDYYGETNVYNHVLETADNNYDTTNAIKKFQSVGPCENDETYSHMKDGVAMGDYCGLSVPGKKQGGPGKDTGNSYSYSETAGQKDSSLGTDKLPRLVIIGDDYQDDKKNDDDIGETINPDEPVTYTKVSKVGAKN